MTQALFYSSNAVAMTLAAGIGSGDVSCTLSTATGLPASFPFKLLIGWGTGQQEVVHCTALAGAVATIVRGQDSTTAQAHSIGASVVHGVSAREFNDLEAHVAASAAVHGLAGTVVGTSDAQTLTNKTLTSPAISAPALSGQPTSNFTGPTYTAVSAFVNSWVAGSETTGYAIDASGFVTLRGSIVSGTIGAPAFTLPAGFRPLVDHHFAVYSDNGAGTVVAAGVTVQSTGVVFIGGGSNALVALNNVRFKAEQ